MKASMRLKVIAMVMMVMIGPALTLGTTIARAQAITTAAIYGTVRGTDSVPIEEATVSITNTANGERWQTLTRAGGQYVLEYLSLGGPYTIEARAIGFRPERKVGVGLSLGERERVDFVVATSVLTLPEVTVTAAPDPWRNAGRTGPSQTISDTLASRLPLADRDFSQLTFLSPQVSVTTDLGASVAGQSDRLNGFQIDGATNSDLAGLAGLFGFGTAGGGNGVKALSVEAIRELQILSAPFDVRYGTFAGGLVNAVTRSGSNQWEGSLSAYFEDEGLTGRDVDGNRAADFATRDLTFALGGPIARDRASFFVDLGLQRRSEPPGDGITDESPCVGDPLDGTEICREDAVRLQEILRNTYGREAGSFVPSSSRRPGGNFFGKITLQPAVNNRVEVSHNYARAISRVSRAGFSEFGYQLSSHAAEYPSTINATRLAWTMAAGKLANELTLGRFAVRESCRPATDFPTVVIDLEMEHLVAGVQTGCAERFADQTVWELTDNLSWHSGDHQLTLGTHNELVRIQGADVKFPVGFWQFTSLDALQLGNPSLYVRDVSSELRPEGPRGDFKVNQLGFYLQDRWTATPRLTLTAGLRMDLPLVPRSPVHNPDLFASALGVNTAETPSGIPLWSPRIGFSYALGREGGAFLRGGLGWFSGRPVYQYFKDVYSKTGLERFRLSCEEDDAPEFTLDPASQPTVCDSGELPTPVVSYFSPSFRFPANLRAALGVDAGLPWGIVGTLDALLIVGVNQFDVIDVNLTPPVGSAIGEGGRLLYGTLNPDGFPIPSRITAEFGPVVEMRNASGDRAFSLTAQLQKRLSAGAEVGMAYTYTDARDRLSAIAPTVAGNIFGTPLDGSFDERRLAPSRFGARHKISIHATADLPLGFRLGLFYNGFSGLPYTYVVVGDANADGVEANDIAYVPRNPADIDLVLDGETGGLVPAPAETYAQLEDVIENEPCLRSQRGRVMRRNSCGGPWSTLMNARLSKVIPTRGGQTLELIVDIFDVLSLVDRDWGLQRSVFEDTAGGVALLELVGYNPDLGRGRYVAFSPEPIVSNVDDSRWVVQLGARYVF
jgi:outer membrane receptor protein involved in Fe transport